MEVRKCQNHRAQEEEPPEELQPLRPVGESDQQDKTFVREVMICQRGAKGAAGSAGVVGSAVNVPSSEPEGLGQPDNMLTGVSL